MRRVMKMAAVSVAAVLALSGCGADSFLGGVADVGRQALRGAPVPLERRPAISPERLARTEGQLLYANLESRRSDAYLRPAGGGRGAQTWLARGGFTLSTRGGVLIASRGFGGDLMSVRADELLARRARATAGQGGLFAARTHRYLDSEDRLVATTYVCELIGHGPEVISWPGGTRRAWRLDEVCSDGTEGFTNTYWGTPSGTPLRSRQWVGPGLGHINLYLLQGGG